MGESNKMSDLVGPFYASDSVAALLGCPVDDLAEWTSAGRVLGLTTSDGVEVYPAFQFTPDGTLRPEFLSVLRVFGGIDPWTIAVWLRTRHPDLNNTSPDQWLATGNDPDRVRVLAGHRAFDLSA